MRRVLAVGSMDHLTVVVLRALAERGFRVAVAGTGESASVRLSRRCAEFIRVAEDDEEMMAASDAVLASVEAAARETGAELVVPVDVAGALVAHHLRPRLPGVSFYPFAEPETLKALDDKWLFHETLARHDLPRPEARLVSGPEEARALPLPFVLKQRRGAGGHGVRLLRDEAERESELAALTPEDWPRVAQAFVPGPDVDVSFLADRGRLVAYAVQMRERGAIEYFDDAGVADFARRLAAATGYTGLAHVDMRYTDASRREALPIECNPRFWGSFLHMTGLGTDFLGLGLELAAGRVPTSPPAPVGTVHGARAALKRALTGGGLSGPAWAHLRQMLFDPLPELRKAALNALGRGEGWP
ncbi:MAG: ATP-grasp domain-containing protein [Elusimicrobiota bacterium]|nr:ATP-grasp domain-containing protein [Elusimicrobiota bacterium]